MSEIKAAIWKPQPTMPFVVPQGLAGVAVAVLTTALLLLSALLVYIYYRRRMRNGGPRARRGKGTQAAPPLTIDAELIVDDYRRGSRSGPRRQRPWFLGLIPTAATVSNGQRPPLLSDPPRGLPFSAALERLWSQDEPPAEPAADDLPDVVPFSGGLAANAAGPRFLATTASGKSLQVVVKTAAVASRQQQQHPQEPLKQSRSWQPSSLEGGRHPLSQPCPFPSSRSLANGDRDQSGTRLASNSSLHSQTGMSMAELAAGNSISAAADGSGNAHQGLQRTFEATTVAAVRPRGSAATAAGLEGSDVEMDNVESTADCGAAGGPGTSASAAATAQLQQQFAGAKDPGRAGTGQAGRSLTASSTVAPVRLSGEAAGGRGGGGGVSSLGRGSGGLDPAAAWYSRRTKAAAAAAAAAQEAAGVAKVHLS